jgi:aspartate/tyrosine/aromatic aminotransferase
MNLGVGAYRDGNLKPYPFKIVKKVEAEIVADKSLDMEYLGIDGYGPFVTASRNLILGKDSDSVKSGRVASS